MEVVIFVFWWSAFVLALSNYLLTTNSFRLEMRKDAEDFMVHLLGDILLDTTILLVQKKVILN